MKARKPKFNTLENLFTALIYVCCNNETADRELREFITNSDVSGKEKECIISFYDTASEKLRKEEN